MTNRTFGASRGGAGKERLQENSSPARLRAPVLGTVAGLNASPSTREGFAKSAIRGGADPRNLGPPGQVRTTASGRSRGCRRPASRARERHRETPKGSRSNHPEGDARTAIILRQADEVTRAHPDFAPLRREGLARRTPVVQSHLYSGSGSAGMNYGDYAYIEAFPRGIAPSSSPTRTSPPAQIFEVWIAGRAGERPHASDRPLRAAEAPRTGSSPTSKRPRVPDEERLSPHVDARPAARVQIARSGTGSPIHRYMRGKLRSDAAEVTRLRRHFATRLSSSRRTRPD